MTGLRAAPLLVLGAVMMGCGSSTPAASPAPGGLRAELAGSPPALAHLHGEADRLIGGGPRAFAAVVAGLRGYPIVVNKWASWCEPCQSEFPVFQRVSAALGRRIAFIGLDGRDQDPAAAAFLRRFPVSYPSYVDPGESIARTLQAATYYPETIFLTAGGRVSHLHAGPYESDAALRRDVGRYAQPRGGPSR